jgi:hypothetical protein
MKKSIIKFALLACALPLVFSLSSCSDDDDDTAQPVTPVSGNNNSNNQNPANFFIINGGPFTNVKFDYANATMLRAWNYTADSTILYFNKNSTDYAAVLVRGNGTGNFGWSAGNTLSMIFQHNGGYYALTCDQAAATGAVQVTEFGPTGGRVKGSVSASTVVKDAMTGTEYPVTLSGSFDLLRAH